MAWFQTMLASLPAVEEYWPMSTQASPSPESAAMLVQSSPLWPSTMTAPSLPALVGVKPVMGPMFWAAALLLIAPRSASGLTWSVAREDAICPLTSWLVAPPVLLEAVAVSPVWKIGQASWALWRLSVAYHCS